MAEITRYSDDRKFAFAAIDMTDVYRGQLTKAHRGAAFLPSGQIVIQDEIAAGDIDEPAAVRWAMVTDAEINIKSDKKAVLEKQGKSMAFELLGPDDAKIEIYSAEPRAEFDAPNPGMKIIGFEVRLSSNQETALVVQITPGQGTNSFYEPRPLSAWP